MSSTIFESANLVPGTYTGTLVNSRVAWSVRTRNVGVTLYWDVVTPRGCEGRVWRTLWLTPKSLPQSKAELSGLGIQTLADLDNDPPVPAGAACRLVIAEVRDRNGCVENRIVRWQVLPDAKLQAKGDCEK